MRATLEAQPATLEAQQSALAAVQSVSTKTAKLLGRIWIATPNFSKPGKMKAKRQGLWNITEMILVVEVFLLRQIQDLILD